MKLILTKAEIEKFVLAGIKAKGHKIDEQTLRPVLERHGTYEDTEYEFNGYEVQLVDPDYDRFDHELQGFIADNPSALPPWSG